MPVRLIIMALNSSNSIYNKLAPEMAPYNAVAVFVDLKQEVIPLRVDHDHDSRQHSLKLLLRDFPVTVLQPS